VRLVDGLAVLLPAARLALVTCVLCGLAYPLGLTVLAQWLMPEQANGSLVVDPDGTILGSRLIGQRWDGPEWFHGRPSATTTGDPAVPLPYNAAASGGSNLGPTSKALADRVKEDVDKLKAENPSQPVPVDLVTTSGSGLDPDISPEAAVFQVPRVAKARNIPEAKLRLLVEQHIERRTLGMLGEPRVNVLLLNLALDRLGTG